MKIIADNKIPFLKGVLEPFCDVEYMQGNKISNADLKNAEGLIIRTRTKCNKELLRDTKVKFIATATIGFDHIDTDFCENNGIKWTNAPGCNAGSVQQWFMAAILYHAMENKIDLTTRTLGIIGVGNVGSKILRFADILGVRVLINDPPIARRKGLCGFNNLETLQQECDIFTFHVPLNMEGVDKTYHMVNEQFINKINQGCLIINSSRGEVIDENVLLPAVKTGKIGGIILDVWENEPDINPELLELSSICTSHIAGYSADGKANGTAMSVQAISNYFDFPLSDWYPDELPTENIEDIIIDARQKSRQAIITEAILKTYPVLRDDNNLRSNIEDFEQLRGSYPVRREPKAWTVKLENDNRNFRTSLQKLGFKLK